MSKQILVTDDCWSLGPYYSRKFTRPDGIERGTGKMYSEEELKALDDYQSAETDLSELGYKTKDYE